MSRSARCWAVLALCAACGPRALPDVLIDGEFDDWNGTARVSGGQVIRDFGIAADGNVLSVTFTFASELNLQSMDGTVELQLDADGDASTGELADGIAGIDATVSFSHGGGGVAVRTAGNTAWQSSYAVGLAYAPTHASTRFEVGLDRTRLPDPGDRVVRAWLARIGPDGEVLDRVGPSATRVPPLTHPTVPAGADALARAPGADLRIATWNVGDRTPLRSPAPFRRILRALDADVLLLDELSPDIDTTYLRGLLPTPSRWAIVLGPSGGRQRTAVASRLPLTPAAALQRVGYPSGIVDLPAVPGSQLAKDLVTIASDGVPTTGAVVRVGDTRVLAVPLDLFCCGRIGGPEDAGRIQTAEAVNRAVRVAVQDEAVNVVIVGGDLNLVGARTPLDRLRAGLDPAGGDLFPATAVTLDGRSRSTWRNPGPFPPGRLDWLLVSPSSADVLRAIVFDASALSVEAQAGLGLLPEDSDVTDHLPVVADLRIKATPTREPSDPSN